MKSVVPVVAHAGSGAKVYVGGQTADEADYFQAVSSPTPYVLAFILGLSFLLLMLAFRSLTITAVSVLLNLLSAGAAYGLLTLVFIHGVGAGIFGFQKVPVIDAWVPLFMITPTTLAVILGGVTTAAVLPGGRDASGAASVHFAPSAERGSARQ